MNHKNIKRILHRIKEEMVSTFMISKVVGIKKALKTFIAKIDIQIMNYNGYYENKNRKKHLIEKHKIMLEYYTKTFGNFLNEYKINVENKEDMSNVIWICWWQGEENAPLIVKKCIESIRKHAGKHKVIVLTEENYKEYVTIPEWVEKKRKDGIITRTNYSDLLRLSLLAEHGGMWLDSTFYCISDEIQEYFKLPLWSIKRPEYFHASVASGYFAGYSLRCNYENRYIFATIRDYFLNYWKNNDIMVDYLMVDYMIELAKNNNPQIEEEFKRITPNNENCDELFKILQETYNQNLWESLKKDTSLFKLTWKQYFPKEKVGKKTFYGMLIDGKLS